MCTHRLLDDTGLTRNLSAFWAYIHPPAGQKKYTPTRAVNSGDGLGFESAADQTGPLSHSHDRALIPDSSASRPGTIKAPNG